MSDMMLLGDTKLSERSARPACQWQEAVLPTLYMALCDGTRAVSAQVWGGLCPCHSGRVLSCLMTVLQRVGDGTAPPAFVAAL